MQNQALVTALHLDSGEAETIALALELGADLVLGWTGGTPRGPETGAPCCFGLLLEAKSRSAVDAIRPHLDALRHKAGFYFAEQVYHSALTLAGEIDT